jgi:hypothetical protein
MFRTVKRWLGLLPPPIDWGDVPAWCVERGLSFRRERDDQGFVVEGHHDDRSWRLEWGPPQRDYLIHPELRIRCEIGAPERLHMLVMTTPLADALERLAYDRFTEATRTESDIAMPEEARWVMMYPALDLAAWRDLRQRVRVFGPEADALRAWLQSGLAESIAAALDRGPLMQPSVLEPLVLMTLRGRLYLRTALATPTPAALELAIALARVAIRGASSAITALPVDPMSAADPADSQATAWQAESHLAGPGWTGPRP